MSLKLSGLGICRATPGSQRYSIVVNSSAVLASQAVEMSFTPLTCASQSVIVTESSVCGLPLGTPGLHFIYLFSENSFHNYYTLVCIITSVRIVGHNLPDLCCND